MNYPNKQPIITRVPTQEELVALNEQNANHNPENALRPEQVGVILRGLGIEAPRTERIASNTTPSNPNNSTPNARPIPEPFIQPEFGRTLNAEEAAHLRAQEAASRFSPSSEPR